MKMQRMITVENGERVVKTVPVPDLEEDGNPSGSYEFLFMALGGGIPPLPDLDG